MILDLHHRLNTDGVFLDKVTRLIRRIKDLDEDEAKGREVDEDRQKTIMEVLRTCNYNASLLIPVLWPAFPRNKPLSFLSQPFSTSFLDFNPGGSTTMVTGRQAGKSSGLAVRGRLMADMIPRYSTLYVAPHPEHVKTYRDKYRELERAYLYPVIDNNFRQNLGLKEYPNGSLYQMHHVLANSAPVRGKTVDENDFDEYQLFDESLELDVLQTQRASDFKIRFYVGTATTVDSPLAAKYELSSKGSYHVLCTFGHRTELGDKQHAIECMQPDGMVCVPCRRKGIRTRINPENCEQIHEYPERLAMGFKGIHVPQIVIPRYVRKLEEWLVIYEDFKRYGENKFLQEICGIPVEEGMREITRAHLMAICSNDEGIDARAERCHNNHYKWIASGCDWGGSDYRPELSTKLSYTYHCIMGKTIYDQIDILHFKRYEGMDYKDIIENILHDHRRFKGGAIASDAGAGAGYNMLIRERVPATRHFIMNLSGTIQVPFAVPKTEHPYNFFNLHKTDSLTMLFLAIRNKKIRCFNWNEAQPHLMQFLNAYRVPSEGDVNKFRYIKPGSKADDAMMACNFAYAMLQVMSGEEIVEDPSLRSAIIDRLADDVEPHNWSGWPMGSGYEAF